MEEAKNTARAVVRIGYDGLVHKTFRGPQARERYENELRVLQFLDQQRLQLRAKGREKRQF
ncbi:MAG: hypothetical protein ACJ0BK_02015 [Coraliomargaritaceae bacterium]